MAYKVFSNGDALTGGELNTYLMNQAVISFATTTARDAALPSPTEGTPIVWLEDSNKHVYYNGSAWTDLVTPASSGNAIINGGFDISQRGTSFTAHGYSLDRWFATGATAVATQTISQQALTPGSITGLEVPYFMRHVVTNLNGATAIQLHQRIEDVRTFANQTATLSFYAKADAARTVTIKVSQQFGTGGSSPVDLSQTVNLTTSWARYSLTFNIASISGKTIGAGNFLMVEFSYPLATFTIEITGVQLEAGSTATPFKRNGSNIQGELAACQRYYVRTNYGANTGYADILAPTVTYSSTNAIVMFKLPTTLRGEPTSIDYSTLRMSDGVNLFAVSSLTIDSSSTPDMANLVGVSSGMTQFRSGWLQQNNSTTAFVGIGCEL
jgi:hypothetical protein